jgi:hypothetical protein
MALPRTAKEAFYGPLKQVAAQYVPLLMARMRVLQERANGAIEYLEAEEEDSPALVLMDEKERTVGMAEAQTTLHKSVLEAGLCQTLVGAFADLLENDYARIKDSSCFFVDKDGDIIPLYEENGLYDADD